MQDLCEENFKTLLKDAKKKIKNRQTNIKTYQVLGQKTKQETYISVFPKLFYKGNVVSIKILMIFLFCSRTGYTNKKFIC